MTNSGAELALRLETQLARHAVPGASIAVLADGRVTTAAAGVLSLDTGVSATPDSLFQIGSITKPYTTSLVMQLVEQGRVELDVPVRTYLPELKLADPEAAEAVTLRHLLTHTSGIQGDHFPDLGRGDDAVARFVASCADIGQTHPLGATMSYCNTGYVIAGRIVERVTGETWDEALRRRLVEPLGLDHTHTLLEEVLRFRSAIGHIERDGAIQTVAQWGLPRSCGPIGLICAAAADVVAFARLHLDGGRAADGTEVLSQESVAAMQTAQVALPNPHTFLASHWGLGWILYDPDGRGVYGHDGGTIGQASFLRVVPDAGVAIALLTNGGRARDLFEELVRPLLGELAGVSLSRHPEPPEHTADVALEQYVGVYERLGTRLEVERRGRGLVGRFIGTGPLADVAGDPVTELELVAVRPGLFVTHHASELTWNPLVFYGLDDGSRYAHFDGRATPKIA